MVAAEIGPCPLDHDGLVEGHPRQFRRQLPDARRRDPDPRRHRLGRIIGREIPFGQMLEHRAMPLTDRAQIGLHALPVPGAGIPVRRSITNGWLSALLRNSPFVGPSVSSTSKAALVHRAR